MLVIVIDVYSKSWDKGLISLCSMEECLHLLAKFVVSRHLLSQSAVTAVVGVAKDRVFLVWRSDQQSDNTCPISTPVLLKVFMKAVHSNKRKREESEKGEEEEEEELEGAPLSGGLASAFCILNRFYGDGKLLDHLTIQEEEEEEGESLAQEAPTFSSHFGSSSSINSTAQEHSVNSSSSSRRQQHAASSNDGHLRSEEIAGTARSPPKSNLRVLLVTSRDIPSAQYIAVMNVVFAAQSMKVMIDCLGLSALEASIEPTVSLLQQIASRTGGCFFQPSELLLEEETDAEKASVASPAVSPESQEALLNMLYQWCISYFLPSASERSSLLLPKPKSIPSSAVCFCHARELSVGYVCSICLAAYCERVPVCMTCSSKFVIPRVG